MKRGTIIKGIITRYATVVLGVVATAVPYSAGAVSVSGDIAFISSPASVLPGALESSRTAWAFAEQQDLDLSGDLMVDELLSTGIAGSILAGTTINSFFLHFDPEGTSNSVPDVTTVNGSLTFATPIIGVIWGGVPCAHCPVSSMFLDSSDDLGNLGTLYPTGGLGRGLETEDFYARNGTRDFLSFSPDDRTITVSLSALPLRSDQLRIITQLPEPGTLWLMSLGLLLLLKARFAR